MTASDLSHKPFYETRDGAFAPNGIARSPWRAGHQNGLALGALLAHTLLEAQPPEGMNIARFTLDILRPAPMAPTQARWTRLRDGRRTLVLEGRLTVDGVDVAIASALFVRRADEGAPATIFAPPSPAPEDALENFMMPLKTGLESRIIRRGAAGDPQFGRCWVRPLTRVAADTPIHPIVAAVMACDFGGGVSSGLDKQLWSSPNVDIAAHFVRPPRDEWILVEAQTVMAGNGAATVETRLSDRFGLFGRSHLTLVVSPVDAALATVPATPPAAASR